MVRTMYEDDVHTRPCHELPVPSQDRDVEPVSQRPRDAVTVAIMMHPPRQSPNDLLMCGRMLDRCCDTAVVARALYRSPSHSRCSPGMSVPQAPLHHQCHRASARRRALAPSTLPMSARAPRRSWSARSCVGIRRRPIVPGRDFDIAVTSVLHASAAPSRLAVRDLPSDYCGSHAWARLGDRVIALNVHVNTARSSARSGPVRPPATCRRSSRRPGRRSRTRWRCWREPPPTDTADSSASARRRNRKQFLSSRSGLVLLSAALTHGSGRCSRSDPRRLLLDESPSAGSAVCVMSYHCAD